MALGILGLAGCGSAPAPPAAPAFAGAPVNGGSAASLLALRGRVVMLNFWATWCIPCRAEVPDLEHEYRAHQAEGVVVIGADYQEPREQVLPFLEEIGVTYPVLLDSGTIHDAYGVHGLPETFVISRGGRIVVARVGAASRQTMEQELARARAAP